MVEEGELKQRFHKDMFYVIEGDSIESARKYMREMTWENHAISKDNFDKLIDEAKQEFPRIPTVGNPLPYKSDCQCLLEIQHWFLKWFGDPK